MAKSAEKKEVKKSEPAAEPRQSKAIARYMRIAPRKLRRVIQSVRRKPVYKAMEILGTLPQKGARLAGKVLKSAIANAKVQGLDANCLIVKEFRADCAPSLSCLSTATRTVLMALRSAERWAALRARCASA